MYCWAKREEKEGTILSAFLPHLSSPIRSLCCALVRGQRCEKHEILVPRGSYLLFLPPFLLPRFRHFPRFSSFQTQPRPPPSLVRSKKLFIATRRGNNRYITHVYKLRIGFNGSTIARHARARRLRDNLPFIYSAVIFYPAINIRREDRDFDCPSSPRIVVSHMRGRTSAGETEAGWKATMREGSIRSDIFENGVARLTPIK